MDTNTPRQSQLSQRIGAEVPNWKAPPTPPREPLVGRYARVEPLDPARHGKDLFDAFAADTDGRNWTYLPEEPFDDRDDFQRWLETLSPQTDPLFFAFIDLATGKAVGIGSYLRIMPQVGSIEVGWILFSPLMQRTRVATEIMYLMMKQIFELGYRRYEWKCDSLNGPSRRAAERFGFSYEGIFRQAMVYKGRNRDTAWFACIDSEWPRLSAAFETWLTPENFDGNGKQKQSLRDLTAPILAAQDPLG